MKHICNAAQEGRCKHGAGKCLHYGQHTVGRVVVGLIPSKPYGSLDSTNISDVTKFCTEERFCEVQNEVVQCVEVVLFPNMKNPVTVSDELAREFVDWLDKQPLNSYGHVCERLSIRIKQQLK